ncbi:MAG TPA: VPDSG-CTERM sorting domain-containing protein [Chthoniobacterales bacterium]|nr:VPDSG-CTERM sorting domain-containing protein [Chthoniobacterales bacterium]
MKKTISPFKSFPLIAATLATVIIYGLAVRPAEAGYIVTLEQDGPNVVATGSGPLDLTGLIFIGSDFGGPVIAPDNALIVTGATGFFWDFSGFSTISGPTSFGHGARPAFGGTGDHVGIDGISQLLFVPQNYVSGDPLSDSATYPFQTLSTLGVIPGTYKWTWGSGANQKFTLIAAVPDSGCTLGLLFVSLIALFGVSRLRAQQLA